MDTTLFFRDGTSFAGTPKGGAKPFTTIRRICKRCGGKGRSDRWSHTGFVCYECDGSGRGNPIDVKLYTAEQIAKLNAAQGKRQAKKAAAVQEAAVIHQQEAEANRAAFQEEFKDVLPWLSHAGMNEAGYREGFLGDMLQRAHKFAKWSPAQAAAVRTSYARYLADKAKRAASQHVGTLGTGLRTTVTIEHVSYYERAVFNAPWLTETVYITTMRDDDGNALVVKSPRFCEKQGAKLRIRATVKDHSNYKGEAQTEVNRVKVLEHLADDTVSESFTPTKIADCNAP